ncbi:MAG: thiamine phosphate synthase [Candidatus Sulfotelmatobacter sp.]
MLYYITDRAAFAGDEPDRRRQLLDKIAEAARCGVDYIQLREKDLSTRELERLTREALTAVAKAQQLTTGHRQLATALLINSRTDVALATGAHGVHLRSEDVSAGQVRTIWQRSASERSVGKCGAGTLARETSPRRPIVAISCHSPAELAQAAASAADFAVFAPVFEKKDAPAARPAGLGTLKEACGFRIPVLALGGITLENAQSCLDAGAAGIAAVRLFQENDIATLVEKLRSFSRSV